MLTFIKLGGSLITDKQTEGYYCEAVVRRLGQEIRAACDADSSLQLLIGHGSGSFGHVAARRYGTADGVRSPEDWRGFGRVALAAAELSQLVTRTLVSCDLPVWRLQPSASAVCRDGEIIEMATAPLTAALAHGLIPLVHGDVALDTARGGTIVSTEAIFFHLVRHFPAGRILLLGETPGALDRQGRVIPRITPANYPEIETILSGSAAPDVTGGMRTKVQDMLAAAHLRPGMAIHIMGGTEPDLLRQTLLRQAQPGTRITSA